MNDQFAIELKNVTAGYENKAIIEDVSLQIKAGEICTIVGPNGCGKSTLLKVITGALVPFTGEILVFNKSAKEQQKNKVYGYLPQGESYNRNFPVKVKDVVAMTLYANKRILEKLNEEDLKLIDDSLDLVQMLDHKNDFFGDLSGGQKQRVLIARALASQPKLLILDEPSTGLDTVAQDSFYRLLIDLKEKKKLAIIIVSHDIGTVCSFSDTIACLKKNIHFHGSPAVLAKNKEKILEMFGHNVSFLLHDDKCATCRMKHHD